MENLFGELTQIRKQLVVQQSFINECLARIDGLIDNQISGRIINATHPDSMSGNSKRLPPNISSKRDILKYILSVVETPMTAKEIKSELLAYGIVLPNVDQSLVNLERDGKIESKLEGGRKKYAMKK